jgi:hypothetical protein
MPIGWWTKRAKAWIALSTSQSHQQHSCHDYQCERDSYTAATFATCDCLLLHEIVSKTIL